MSEVETALTGADAAPAPEENVQAIPQETAPVESDAQKEERERDERGRFVQKRINELTREKHEARRELDRVRQEVEFLRQQVQQPRHTEAPDPSVDPEAYIQHLADQRVQAALEQRESQWRQQQEQQQFAEVASQFQQRANEYAASHPDFEEAIYNADQVLGHAPHLIDVLARSEHGPAVAHYLGTHMDEAVQLAQMPPHVAAYQLARIEARVSAPKTKPVTAAPAPAPTVGGGSTLPGIRDGMDYEAYRAARMRG